MSRIEVIQRAVFAALGHVKPDYRSPKCLDDAAMAIAKFVDNELGQEEAALTRLSERCDAGWQPIETAPRDTYKVCGPILILGHVEKKWVRFGKWYVQERRWYYSGTSERSQYAQVRGDDPTHWRPLPAPPIADRVSSPVTEKTDG